MISDKKHKTRVKQLAGILFSVLLSVVFLYIAFIGVDFSNVLSILSQASVPWVIISIAVWFASHFIRAIRWKVILHSVKPEMSLSNVLGALMVGYGVNNVIPRMGEISRAVLLGQWEKTSRTTILGSIFVERIIDLIFLALSVLVSIYLWGNTLYVHFPWLKSTMIILSVFLTGIVVVLLLVIRSKTRFSNIIVNLSGKVSKKLSSKIAHIFEMLIEGFSSLKGTRNYLITFLLSVILMCTYALTTYVGFYTIGMQHVRPITFAMGWLVMSISAIGAVIPTPGGTGSYHTLAKSVLLLLGFAGDISMAYAVLTHAMQYIMFILIALFFFFWLNNRSLRLYGVKEKLSDLIEETNMGNL